MDLGEDRRRGERREKREERREKREERRKKREERREKREIIDKVPVSLGSPNTTEQRTR